VISLRQPVYLLGLARQLGLGFGSTANLFSAYYGGRREFLRKLFPETVVLDIPRWGKVPVRTNGYDHGLLTQIFVRNDYRMEADKVLRILDLGANIGMAAIYLSKLFPQAEIACVEPSPRNTPLLERALALNKIRGRVFEAAVGAEPGEIELFLSDRPDCNSVTPSEETNTSVKVPMITVPEIMKQMGWDGIDLLKIDIEGAEKAVLGRNNAWLGKVRFVTGESHVNVGYPYSQLTADLKAYGFELETLIPDTADYGASFRGVNAAR
jgi:FkbM family methyltransferase